MEDEYDFFNKNAIVSVMPDYGGAYLWRKSAESGGVVAILQIVSVATVAIYLFLNIYRRSFMYGKFNLNNVILMMRKMNKVSE